MTQITWSNIDETAAETQISRSRLRSLQANGKLKPGVHWIYKTGTKGGPVAWNVEAIQAWQIEETIRVANGGTVQNIETYEDSNE